MEQLNAPPSRLIFWAIFRVYLAAHLTNQIISYLFLRDMLFSDNSFIPLSSIGYARFLQQHILAFLLGYLLLVFAMALGIGRNFTVFLVFVATKSLQATNSYILNGGRNLLTFLLLYLCFADSFKYLVLRKTQREAGDRWENVFQYTTNIATACVLVHLSLVYFVSGLAKAHSDVWYHGDALYYIFLVERFQGLSWNAELAQNGILVTAMSYGVMLWELYFPVGMDAEISYASVTGGIAHAHGHLYRNDVMGFRGFVRNDVWLFLPGRTDCAFVAPLRAFVGDVERKDPDALGAPL